MDESTVILVVAAFYTVATAPRPWALIVAIVCYVALLVLCIVTETK